MARPDGGARRLGLAVMLAAVVTHSCQSYVFQAYNSDKVVQAAAGQAWLDGRGFVAPVAGADGRAAWLPVVQWPPGYSIAYAAAIRLLRDPFLATTSIDIAAAAVFLFAWWPLANMMRRPSAARGAFIYWTCAASAITFLPSSDSLALACYSVALAAMLAAARGGGAPRVAVAGLAVGAACAVRFAYWPMAWIPIAPFLWTRRNEARAWRAAAAYAAAVGAAFAWVARWNLHSTGSAATVLPGVGAASSGPFWRQLFPLPPFGATALGVDGAWRRLAVSVPELRSGLNLAFWLLTVLVIALTVVAAARALADDGPLDAGPRTLAVWGALTFAVVALLVSALALRVPAYPDGWTYMTDAPRYLAPAYPFIVLALADLANRSLRLGRGIAVCVLLVCGASTMAYRVGQLSNYAARNAAVLPSGPAPRRELRMVFDTVRRFAGLHGAPPRYCDPNPLRRSIAIMAGAAAASSCGESGADDTNGGPRLRARPGADGALLEILDR